MTAVIRPRARDDIIRQFRWYLVEQDAPDAAFRFITAFEESVANLLRMPKMGTRKRLSNPALIGLRVWRVEGFEEALIFYVEEESSLKIIRVLHGRRDINGILRKELSEFEDAQ